MKYRIIIDVEIDSDADIAELSQNTWEATVKEAQISHLRWVMEWMTSNKSEHNPAATKHAIAYHNTWADILGKAEFKLEKI